MKIKSRKVSLQEFFLLWAFQRGWEVPDIHYEMMAFLADYKNWKDNKGLLEVFRDAAKSTMVGLFVTWMLYIDPTLRFLILSADKKTAAKMTEGIKDIVKRHPLAHALHGKENSWRADTLVVNGSTDGRNPSVTAWGVLSNITGSRADWVIYDDVEVPNNTRTEDDRDKLRIKLDEPTHILVPGGYELFIGTPHSHDSIYTELEGNSSKDQPFRDGNASLIKIPVMRNHTGDFPNITGEYTWPERFNEEVVHNKQVNSTTKGHFLSQYLLLPYNPEETELDPSLISEYDGELHVHASNGGTAAWIRRSPEDPGVRLAGVSAFWDPAMSANRDDSVLAIVFTTENGHYYIHRTVKVIGERDADKQIAHVQELMKKSYVNHVIIESNGVGAFLPALFRQRSAGMGLTCESKPTSQNKQEKIVEAFETPLAAGYIHAHASVMASPFRTQLRDFSALGAPGKDDFIDATASAMMNQPIRIRAGLAGHRFTTWNQMSGSIDVPIDGVAF